jgi:hypothetical protein
MDPNSLPRTSGRQRLTGSGLYHWERTLGEPSFGCHRLGVKPRKQDFRVSGHGLYEKP